MLFINSGAAPFVLFLAPRSGNEIGIHNSFTSIKLMGEKFGAAAFISAITKVAS
jgi:hypothetical protein